MIPVGIDFTSASVVRSRISDTSRRTSLMTRPQRASGFVHAIVAAFVEVVAYAGQQRERPVGEPHDISECDEFGGAAQAIAAEFSPNTLDKTFIAKLGHDRFEELARYVFLGGNGAYLLRCRAGTAGEIHHCLQCISAALRKHRISSPFLTLAPSSWRREQSQARGQWIGVSRFVPASGPVVHSAAAWASTSKKRFSGRGRPRWSRSVVPS